MSSTNIWWTAFVVLFKWLHCDFWPFPLVCISLGTSEELVTIKLCATVSDTFYTFSAWCWQTISIRLTLWAVIVRTVVWAGSGNVVVSLCQTTVFCTTRLFWMLSFIKSFMLYGRYLSKPNIYHNLSISLTHTAKNIQECLDCAFGCVSQDDVVATVGFRCRLIRKEIVYVDTHSLWHRNSKDGPSWSCLSSPMYNVSCRLLLACIIDLMRSTPTVISSFSDLLQPYI